MTKVNAKTKIKSFLLLHREFQNFSNASSASIVSCNSTATQRLDRRHIITKNDIMDILDDGEVVIQHLAEVKTGSKRIVDVFRVSADGQKIVTYRADRRQFNSYGESEGALPLPPEYEQYTFDNLYTNHGKCRLMETSIEFDFTDLNGTKISIRTVESRRYLIMMIPLNC